MISQKTEKQQLIDFLLLTAANLQNDQLDIKVADYSTEGGVNAILELTGKFSDQKLGIPESLSDRPVAYEVINDSYFHNFQNKVTFAMNQGLIPIGGINTVFVPPGPPGQKDYGSGWWFAQAMYRTVNTGNDQ